MNVLELLECVMLSSDCHACNVLAELVAGSVDNFIAMMNARAAALGCTETNFVNTSGYPDPNHQCIQSVPDYEGSISLSCISGYCSNAGSSHPGY